MVTPRQWWAVVNTLEYPPAKILPGENLSVAGPAVAQLEVFFSSDYL